MIYEIYTTDIPAALTNGASLVVISADGQLALVQSANPVECISSYDHSELNALISEAKWRQPCKDCEV